MSARTSARICDQAVEASEQSALSGASRVCPLSALLASALPLYLSVCLVWGPGQASPWRDLWVGGCVSLCS